ncbi:hypothetical protein F2Q68_00011368 [Brassica cretica]|uniref:No apical meristem-associated C-terminal domain-containing protein n=1 Tax=Brassica cretica TaxID=69181 RepID=A0A8S9KPP6_BRACR|nr:hypothetical protein F2Q68_00011368 [Brassica cretica]
MSSLSVDLLACDKHVSLSRWLSWRKSNRKDGSIEVEKALKKITATGKHDAEEGWIKGEDGIYCSSTASSKASGADSGDDANTNRPPGVKQSKACSKKTLADEKHLSKFQSMWSIKQQDLALKERISKMKLLDSLLAKEGPLEGYEEALKKKIANELMNN